MSALAFDVNSIFEFRLLKAITFYSKVSSVTIFYSFNGEVNVSGIMPNADTVNTARLAEILGNNEPSVSVT